MKKKTLVWIYSLQGQLPHMVRVVQGDQVTEIPVSNTNIKTVRSAMFNLFGRCEFTYVETIEKGGLETYERPVENE